MILPILCTIRFSKSRQATSRAINKTNRKDIMIKIEIDKKLVIITAPRLIHSHTLIISQLWEIMLTHVKSKEGVNYVTVNFPKKEGNFS